MKTNLLGITAAVFMLLTAAILFSGCVQNPEKNTGTTIPLPPTTPVSIGYIQSFDHSLGYGFEYPETWAMHEPGEFSLTQGVKKVDMFTKSQEGTSITIIAKTTEWKSLDEVKNLFKETYSETIIKEGFIEVNGVKGYEMTRLDSPMKSKVVLFLVGDMAYELRYDTSEDLYDASESVFDHVVGSFNIK